LEVAKINAQKHNISEKVEFLRGRFLNPLIDNSLFKIHDSSILVLANLPYLSESIYKSSPESVKKYEPKGALLSGNDGLDHYRKLLNQIKMLSAKRCPSITAILEISPQQKPLIVREIKSHLPSAKINLKKDLADKWRIAIIIAQ
jgi:release factor glutamine methyltransferase